MSDPLRGFRHDDPVVPLCEKCGAPSFPYPPPNWKCWACGTINNVIVPKPRRQPPRIAVPVFPFDT